MVRGDGGGAPHRAFALTVPPRHRPPLYSNEAVWDFYRTAPTYRRDLGVYIKDKLIRTMLALGDKAEVRYCGHAGIGRNEANDVVFPLYAVTFDDRGERKSFFVVLTVERIALTNGRGDWQLKRRGRRAAGVSVRGERARAEGRRHNSAVGSQQSAVSSQQCSKSAISNQQSAVACQQYSTASRVFRVCYSPLSTLHSPLPHAVAALFISASSRRAVRPCGAVRPSARRPRPGGSGGRLARRPTRRPSSPWHPNWRRDP